MTKILLLFKNSRRHRTIARFGTARLVVNAAGKFELQGGSRAERIEAREWASLFMHEIAV